MLRRSRVSRRTEAEESAKKELEDMDEDDD